MTTPIERALISLEGLSVGDAFGETAFYTAYSPPSRQELPAGTWPWTDDTHMALSIVETLFTCGRIDQDALALHFARRFIEAPYRGYAGGAALLLTQITQGADWRQAAPALFHGGSYGNGGAMRAAPIGGFFADDPARAAQEGRLSAMVTHAHPEGQAGAMAVAAAAAVAADPHHPAGSEFIQSVLRFTPEGETRRRMEHSLTIPPTDLRAAMFQLGTGAGVSAQDTVPYCIWCAAYHLDDFADALWWTVGGLGDCDTTCAIVGGIVALSAPAPADWVAHREPLPQDWIRAVNRAGGKT